MVLWQNKFFYKKNHIYIIQKNHINNLLAFINGFCLAVFIFKPIEDRIEGLVLSYATCREDYYESWLLCHLPRKVNKNDRTARVA
jgi:hypothetical protein